MRRDEARKKNDEWRGEGVGGIYERNRIMIKGGGGGGGDGGEEG